MGAHLRNGRNISEEQQRRELELQSRYPISPAAAERIRRIRAQSAASTRLREDILQAGSDRLESGSIPQRCEHVGDLTSASIQRFDPSASSYRQASVEPLPVYSTAVNPYPDHREQTDDPRRDSDERRDSSRDPSDDDGRRRIRSPFRNRQVYAGPPMAPVRTSQASGERTLDENGYQSSHLDARVTDQPRRSRGDDQTQRGMVSSRRVDLPRDFTSRSYESNHPDASTKPSRADGSVDPSHPYGESSHLRSTSPIPKREQSHQQPISSAQNPSTNSGHYVPGLYPFGNSRAVVTTPSTANSTAYFTPGVPGTTRHNKTGDAPSNIRQPSISTPNQSTTVLPPAPPSLRASSPTTWTRPRQRMATNRSEHEDGKDGSFFRKSGESPRTNEPNSWSRQGRKKPPLSTISESSTSPISSPLDNHLETSVNCPSDPSSKEQFLNNLNSQFVPDTTFLLEDKLRDMFSNFLSELTTTLDTVSPTLVKACVSQFESSVHKSIQEMLTNDIMPVIVSEVLHYVTNNPLNNEPIVSIKEELNPLKDFIKENIECVQDILHVNDSQMQSNTDQLKQNVIELQKTQHEQFHYIIQQLKELHHNENNRFDQLQRRLGDMNQMISTLPEKINHLPAPEERAPPPHLHYNNPFLNHMKHGPPVLQEPTVPHQPETAVSPVPVTNNEPEWMTLFPFIKHNIDKEVRREIWKAIPKTNEWETFNGELPYNHELWLQNIEVFVKDYYLLDHMIVSRLTTILTSTAKNWYLGLRNKHEDKSWAWWKNAIRNKFGTDNWKWRVQQEFDADHFYLENKKIHKWFNTQRDRLRAFQPDLSEFLVCEKIMKQCPGTLYHAIESRYKGDPSNMCFEDMVIIAEDIIDRTMRPTKPTYHSPYQSNRQSSQPQYPPRKGDSQKQDSDTKKTSPSPNGTKGPKYFFCLQTGHLSKDCPKKRDRINNVEGQSGENEPEEDDRQDDYDYDQPLNSDDEKDDSQQDPALVLAMH
ncbi:hypothetical protein MJO28_008597 [Puccinia striiformis f. sp. tritici]|uniref:Uncharacterized protein n=1 Tax=Puccinia striiformis f. sp. tritici TaxID=168172 RepID=A0ACC0ED52_9BASI|nr:hypothetical protein MJO28_008597 [Puccinia striiformis f. sp. tritici]